MQRIIAIDGNSLVKRKGMNRLGGIARVTNDLINALSKINNLPFEIVVCTQTIKGKLTLDNKKIKKINIPIPHGGFHEFIFKNTPIIEFITSSKLIHIPHNYATVYDPKKTVLTMHDAMFFSYPEQFLGHDDMRIKCKNLAKSCRSIITCSHSSKNDIVKYIGVSPEKITVTPWGINNSIFYPTNKQNAFKLIKNEYNINRQYFISVSCDIGRKNTISIMKAFKKCLSTNIGHDLVLIWSDPPENILQEYSKEINSSRIHILSNVNDENLRQLYTASTLSWFPSKYEGFGLPVIESMACGTPVVTCNNSSLAEVGGDAAIYVMPEDIMSMADIMKEFDIGYNRYDELVNKSINHSSSFTWEKTAKDYMRFYIENL
jgi:glycosyltransferase involved in cell wall biosynthesis